MKAHRRKHGHVHLCEAQLLAGQVEEDAVNAKRSLALVRRHGQRSQEAWTQRLLGEAAAISEPPSLKAAEGSSQEAMTLATGFDVRSLLAHCHFDLGTLSRLAGRPEHAMENFVNATAMWRKWKRDSGWKRRRLK